VHDGEVKEAALSTRDKGCGATDDVVIKASVQHKRMKIGEVLDSASGYAQGYPL
jgi:hypothetical protein